jgi:parvulin-like peptidyl-prolyl isomerase
MKRTLHHLIGGLLLSLAAAAALGADAPAAGVFARVGEQLITQDEFDAAFAAAARAKFYHGKPPEQELAALQRSVGQQLVERSLLLAEARQRQLQPDSAAIAKTVQGYEQRYAGNAKWQENRDRLLPPLVARLEQDDLLSQLEARVRGAVHASAADAQTYYQANPAKFTEPEQLHVAVILFKVEPSAPTAQWQAVDVQAQAVAGRARAGEDFAALARQYSADPSAAKGGDMGYLHLGMLPDGTQQALAKLQPGGTTDSLRLLQGLGVFRLVERKQARLQPLAAVQARAQELAQREQSERAWRDLIAALRLKTPAQLDTSRYLPLTVAAGSTAQ